MKTLERIERIKDNKIKNQYDIIKTIADSKEITITALCNRTGISRQWLWYGGTRNKLSENILQKINNYFCMDINFFRQFYNDNIQRINQNIGNDLVDEAKNQR